MARKGENIYRRRDGRWEGRYIRGRRPDGRALYASVYGRQYWEVKEKLHAFKAQNIGWKVRTLTQGTAEHWLTHWLGAVLPGRVKPSTLASYQSKLNKHVLPALGNRPIAAITRKDLQTLADTLAKQGLAPSTVTAVFRVLRAALGWAVGEGILPVNPCIGVTLSAGKQKPVRALTIEEQNNLMQQAEICGDRAVILALYTGMRVGEIAALEWADIDWQGDVIRVRKTAQRLPSNAGGRHTAIAVGPPKTASSLRDIPISPKLRQWLLAWHTQSGGIRFVVTSRGDRAEPRVIAYRFRRLTDRAGVEGATFHTLRHTFATRCIEQGIDPVTISHLLGHKSVKMTLDVYAHATAQQRREAVRRLDIGYAQNRSKARMGVLQPSASD